jgi:uncharacterized membrane protein
MSPLILWTVGEILVFTPLAYLACVYFWRRYRQEPSGLKLVLFGSAVAATTAATLLAIPTLFYVAGLPQPFSGLLVLVAIDILLPSSVAAAGYLWWLDR